jgi:hypothetical protein
MELLAWTGQISLVQILPFKKVHSFLLRSSILTLLLKQPLVSVLHGGAITTSQFVTAYLDFDDYFDRANSVTVNAPVTLINGSGVDLGQWIANRVYFNGIPPALSSPTPSLLSSSHSSVIHKTGSYSQLGGFITLFVPIFSATSTHCGMLKKPTQRGEKEARNKY